MTSERLDNIHDIGTLTQPRQSYFDDPRFKTTRTTEITGNSLFKMGVVDVFAHHPRTGQVWDITAFVDGITYQEDYETPFASIELSLVNPTNILSYVQPGMWISMHGPYFPHYGARGTYQEIDRGQIVSVQAKMGDDKRASVLVKDPGWLISKNKIPYRLPEGTLTERLRFMEVRGFLTLDENLPDIDYVLAATRGGQESIWDDIMFDIGEINRVNEKKYVLRHHKGKFSVVDTENQVNMWAFEIGSNVLEATKQSSIENFYNMIYVVGQEDNPLEEFGLDSASITLPVTGFAANSDNITYFGQHIMTVSEQLTISTPNAQIQAEQLLEDYGKVEEVFSFSTYSIPGIRWGDKVLLYEPSLDLAGIYYVLSAQHQWTAGSFLMTLTVQYDSPAPEEVRDVALEDLASFLGVQVGDIQYDPNTDATSDGEAQ